MRALLLPVLLFSLLSVPPARACPAYTVTHGLHGAFERLDFLLPAAQVQKVSVSAGYSVNLNLLPSSDCRVSWLTLLAAAQVGLGQSAASGAPAFNVSPVLGVGVYNALVRVALVYDFLDVRPGELSGLLTGRLVPGNLGLLIGTGLNFDLVNLDPSPVNAALRRSEPPPGYVRL